jgi:hypothetical protein
VKLGPYRRGRVHVVAVQCSTCVFRPGNKMSLNPGRLADLVRGNVEADSALQCHHTLPGCDHEDEPAVCRAFYDKYKTTPLRVADSAGLIEFDEWKDGDNGLSR